MIKYPARKLLGRAASLVLAVSVASCQPAFALDFRKMISNAKDGFLQQEADRRPDALDPAQLAAANEKAQSVLDQKSALNQLIQQNQEISAGPVNNIQEANNPGNRVIWSYHAQPGLGGTAFGVVVDAQGNTYAGGADLGSADGRMVIRKFTPTGQLEREFFSDPTDGYDYIMGLAVDSHGNVISTGSLHGGNSIHVEKFSPTGQQLWVYDRIVPPYGVNVGMAVTVDAQDNIYIAGGNGNGNNDIKNSQWWMGKLDPDKNLLWEKTSDPSNNFNPAGVGDGAWAIALGPNNSFYALGFDAGGDHGRWMLEKRNSLTGDLIWTYLSDPSSSDADMPFGVAVDQNTGDAYISGHDGGGHKGPNGSASGRVRVEKISNQGQNVWTFTDDQGPSPQTAAGITLDPRGFLYLTGMEGNGAHYWIRKLTVYGAQVWYYSNRSDQPVEEGMAIAMAPDGSVRVAGYDSAGWRVESVNGDYLGRTQNDETRDAAGRIVEKVETIYDMSDKMIQKITQHLNQNSWWEKVELFHGDHSDYNQITYSGADWTNRSTILARAKNYHLMDSAGNITDDVTENRNAQGSMLDRTSRHYDIDVQSHVERFETWNNGRVEWTENRRQGIDPSSSGGLLLSLARGYQIFDSQNKLVEESRDILGNSDNQIIFTRTTRYNAQENPTQHQIVFYNEARQVRETAQVDFSYNAAGDLTQRVVTYLNPAGQFKSRTTQRMDSPNSWIEEIRTMREDRLQVDWTNNRYTGRFQIDRAVISELWKGFETYNAQGQVTRAFTENDYLTTGRPATTYNTDYNYDSQGRFIGQVATITRYDESGNIINQTIF